MDMNERELWDIYTKDREKTGRCCRRGDALQEGECHLVIHVCLFNSRNQLLIQKRQPFKKGWPNMWDLSAGGSALKGESSSRAAERELYEELGIRMDLSGKRPDFSIHFEKGFDDYFLLEQEIDISQLRLQKEEVQCARWVSREEVLAMQEQGIMIPYWFLDKIFEIRGGDAHGSRKSEIRIDFAARRNLESWMNLIEIVRWNFPGLETEEALEDYRRTVIKNMDRQSAICALEGNMVVGILLFSTKHSMLSCMAVHPEFRRKGIASKMIRLMLTGMERSRDITVTTFREGDEKGTAPRALYQSLGFVPGELCVELGYPCQQFVLRGR